MAKRLYISDPVLRRAQELAEICSHLCPEPGIRWQLDASHVLHMAINIGLDALDTNNARIFEPVDAFVSSTIAAGAKRANVKGRKRPRRRAKR